MVTIVCRLLNMALQSQGVHEPDGVHWANRWAELQNAFSLSQGEVINLKEQVAQLRERRVGETLAALAEKPVDQEVTLRAALLETKREVETLHNEIVAERCQNSKLSDELQSRVEDLARLSNDKYNLQLEKSSVTHEIQGIGRERDTLLRAYKKNEKVAADLRLELERLSTEREKLFNEKCEVRRSLTLEVNDARADAQAQRLVAEGAQESLREAEQRAREAQQRLDVTTISTKSEKTNLEAKVALLEEQLQRGTEMHKATKSATEARLASTSEQLLRAQAALDSSQKEAEKLKKVNEELNGKLMNSENLIRRFLGDDEFSIPDLIEVDRLRGDLAKESSQRQYLQEMLADVQQQVSARYPALRNQQDEMTSLRSKVEELTLQNEGLVAQVRSLEQDQRASSCAEVLDLCAQIDRTPRAVNLESDVRDAATGRETPRSVKCCVGQGPPARAWQADSKFRDIQDLSEQNELLRKSILERTERETEMKREFELLQKDQDQQMEDVKRHLEEKAEQMQVLAETAAWLARERDDAQQMLDRRQTQKCEPPERGASLEKVTTAADPDAGLAEVRRQKVLEEHLARERKKTEQLQKNLEECVDKVDDHKHKILAHQKDAALLRAALQTEEASRRDVATQLNQARRDVSQLTASLAAERSKVAALQKINATLQADKAASEQISTDLHAQLAREGDAYRGLKRDLESSFAKESQLLKMKVQALERDLSASRAELTASSLPDPVDQPDAGARAATKSDGGGTAELLMRVRFAEEQAEEHSRNSALWKSVVAAHESDLQSKQREIQEMQDVVSRLQSQQGGHNREVEQASERARQLESQIADLHRQVCQLQAQLNRKNEASQASQLEGEAKVKGTESMLDLAQREVTNIREEMGHLRRQHQQAMEAHAVDSRHLKQAEESCAALESEVRALQEANSDLEDRLLAARTERTSQLQCLSEQLLHAEAHARALREETARYQEHLLALSQPDSESAKIVASEMRIARETGELRRHELELKCAGTEREAKLLRSEVLDLQCRLDKEQREVAHLHDEVQREQRAISKVGQIGLLEDENRRLQLEVKKLEDESSKAQALLVAARSEVEPLHQSNSELERKQSDLETSKKELEVKLEVWKAQYDEILSKFEAASLPAYMKLKTESARWETERNELTGQNVKLTEEVKQLVAEIGQLGPLKERADVALSVALDYQRSLEAMMKQERSAHVTVESAPERISGSLATAPNPFSVGGSIEAALFSGASGGAQPNTSTKRKALTTEGAEVAPASPVKVLRTSSNEKLLRTSSDDCLDLSVDASISSAAVTPAAVVDVVPAPKKAPFSAKARPAVSSACAALTAGGGGGGFSNAGELRVGGPGSSVVSVPEVVDLEGQVDPSH